MRTSQRSKSQLFKVVCTAVVLAFVCIGCSDDDIPGVDSSNYYGLTADPSNVPGQISLQGLSAATGVQALGGGTGVALSGTYTRAGAAPIALEGFYDTGTGSIFFEDAAGTWSFAGTVSGIVGSGGFTGPAFVGTGSFIIWVGATPSSVTIYCGTGTCSAGCSGTASINLVIGGASAIMAANIDGGPAVSGGVVTGSNVHFDVTVGGLDGNIDGTIAGSSVTGTFDEATNGWAGTWSGSTAACTAAPTLRH